MDWTIYWFMFPVSICIATTAMLSGIGGAAITGGGGQIGPWLQGRIARRTMEKAIAVLFGIIGLSMGWIVLRALAG